MVHHSDPRCARTRRRALEDVNNRISECDSQGGDKGWGDTTKTPEEAQRKQDLRAASAAIRRGEDLHEQTRSALTMRLRLCPHKPIHVQVDHQIAGFCFAINWRHDLNIFSRNAAETLKASTPLAAGTELNVGESRIRAEFWILRS